MDRLRRLTKSKASAKNDDKGDQHAHQKKNILKLPSSSLIARLVGFDGSKPRHENSIFNGSSTLPRTHHPKPSIIGREEKEGTDTGTSRIVVLKPNHPLARDPRNSLSSTGPSSANILGSGKFKGDMSDWTKDEDFVETVDLVDGVDVSASRVREPKNIAKKAIRELNETARTMKETESKEAAKRFHRELQEVFGRMKTEFPSYVKEIPGTGGLHEFSGIDSASESEVLKMTSFNSTESLISRQAKRRLLERWRTAQGSEHVRTCGKGSTLSEMLCIPEEKLKNFIAANAKWDSPSGIRSADGWKDKYSKIKPRSRSLPPPGTRNAKLNAEREYHTDDTLLMSKEARRGSQSDRLHRKITEEEDFSSETSRCSMRKSQSRHGHASNSDALLENQTSRDEVDLLKKISPEEKPMVPPTSTVSSSIGTGASTTLEYYTASSVSSDACYPNVSRSMLKRCDSSGGGQEHLNPKHLSSEAESSGSSKEADLSQISVPEIPSREDVSSGLECFTQLSADLRDLRKQLCLLRRESTLALHTDEIVVSECWESFYIDDVLIECGLYDTDIDEIMPRSKGPNNPLGVCVFYNLEKKYCDEMSAPKYERMLLFDRVRSTVSEISQSCMNLCPWVKPIRGEFGLKWPRCELRNELYRLLAIQDAEVKEEIFSRKVIDKDTYWGDLKKSVDMIGREIEKSLTDDLLMELAMELQFDDI